MANAIVSFFKSKIPQSVKWEEVREEILRAIKSQRGVVYSDDNIKFEISDYYYIITVGKKTWYWVKETGEFDGESFDVEWEPITLAKTTVPQDWRA